MIDVSLSQVQRPLLPPAASIAAYLERIDAARWYSNRGPLLEELETRLCNYLKLPPFSVSLLGTGSAALEAAIIAHAGTARPDRPLALMPSYTFIATALSAIRCGYEPWFVDVDPETWMPDPKALASHPELHRVGLVMAVTAYGCRPDMEAWVAFQAETGCPVVIDGAGAFEQFEADPSLVRSEVPVMLSLHATKTFSTAEGGAVLWRSPDGWARLAQVANFGMSDERRCEMDGFNGKLSEYHAAVGLAQLDHWPERRARFVALADSYRRAAAVSLSMPGTLRLSPEVSGAYVLIDCIDPERADRVCSSLAALGIASRRWYGRGLHGEPLMQGRGHDPMPVTEWLSGTHIGLPAAVDLTDAQIALVVETLSRVN